MTHFDPVLANFDDPKDCDAILSIIDAYAREPQGGGHPLPSQVLASIIPGLRQTPGAFAVLARLPSGESVGAAICFMGFSTFAGRALVNVHDLSVLPAYRSQGIGRRLLQKVEEIAGSRGCSKVTLEVREVNPRAEQLYRSLGYGDPSGFATRFLDKPLNL